MDKKTIFEFIVLINILLILYYLLTEKKNYRSMLYWTLFFILFPIGGFMIYLIIGRGITLPFYYFKDSEENLTLYNNVKFFTSGEELFANIIDEINSARKSIHIESYIFRDDEFTNRLISLLYEKQKNGVNIRIVYDPNGNLQNVKKQFGKLIKIGGKVYPYYRGVYRFLNFNYRNHKKIIVIDGKTAYIGGFNIGKEYLSRHIRITPWRDSQIKVKGECVYHIQKEFIKDYLSASKQKGKSEELDLIKSTSKIYCPLSIISFFPNIDFQNIKQTYMKEIYRAKEIIRIQTPYFVPDIGLLNALKFQLRNNIKVFIMIPKIYDKRIPYYSTLEYAKELYNEGATIFFYQGFIHAKALIVDESFLSIGSSNFDIRSFHHNLELNAFIYEFGKVNEYLKIYNEDIKHSDILDEEFDKKELKKYRFGSKVIKILSSLM